MTCAFAPPAHLTIDSMILDATRAWRDARDSRQPTQPALHRVLVTHRCGVLAPVIDSVLTLYEACSGRRFRVGDSVHVGLSADEHRFLNLLRGPDGCDAAMLDASNSPGLAPALRIALRSTRIMLRLALEPAGGNAPSPGSRLPTMAGMVANDAWECRTG